MTELGVFVLGFTITLACICIVDIVVASSPMVK